MSEAPGTVLSARTPSFANSQPAADADRSRLPTIAALAVALVLALAWTIPLSREIAWGWDESMHAELPAARMLVAAELGHWRESARALLDCSSYPFVYPVLLALVQAVFGIGEHVCRVLGTLTWCATLFGLYLLGREIARELCVRGGREKISLELLPWLAMALGALSPLALEYAGTLFLEIPFTCAAVFALRAWMRRRSAQDERERARRELAAGAWIALAFFVKFNYGLMLGAGLALDWIADAWSAARRGEARAQLARTVWLCAVPVASALWWFVLPLPGGPATGRDHRADFVQFLSGNTGLITPFAHKPLNAFGHFALNPRAMLIELVLLVASLRFAAMPSVRALWLVFLLLWVPVWMHPFHLDRFFIPGGAAIWPLAACGAASLLRISPRARIVSLAAATAIVLAPIDDTLWVADRVGQGATDGALRAYQKQLFASWHDLGGARSIRSAGLARGECDAFLDAIAGEVKPEENLGWFGLSNELSPAAVHIGLLQRGGSRERFLRESTRKIDVSYFPHDPQWNDRELADFAREFDVIFFTESADVDPVDHRPFMDFKARKGRQFMLDYCRRLTGALGYSQREVARIPIALPVGAPRVVRLFACRKP
jgi:hypothetical protein